MNDSGKDILIPVTERDGRFYPVVEAITGPSAPRKEMTHAPFESQGFQMEELYVPWGRDNRFPIDVRKKLLEVPIAMGALDRLVKMMFGEGIFYYNDTGSTRPERAHMPEIEDFMRRCRINTEWFVAQCWDYRYYTNTFSELVMNNDKSKIVELWHKPAEHCRLVPQNTRSNKVEWIRYSPLFSTINNLTKSEMKSIPLFRWYEEEAFFSFLRDKKFAWHSRLYSPGMTYYAVPPWVGLFKSCGWLDISANVPRIVSAMQNNQIAIKYQIKISIGYFTNKYADEWDNYSWQKREELVQKKITELTEALEGTDNVFRSLAHTVGEDPITGRKLGDIEIIAVDDKVKTGTWIPDSQISDAQIMMAFGVHPSQVGLQPQGGKMGAGSGSDQRESYNTAIGLNTLEQEIILEPLNFISRYNKWGVKFAVSHSSHTTSNLVESGIVPGPATIQPQ